MNTDTVNIKFRHRLGKPSNPVEGWFYWVERENDTSQIWYAVNTNPDDMLLLSDEVGEGLKQRLEEAEGNVEQMQEILDEIVSKNYLTQDDLEGYAKIEDVHDIELTEEDYDAIAEKVNQKTFSLKWIEI